MSATLQGLYQHMATGQRVRVQGFTNCPQTRREMIAYYHLNDPQHKRQMASEEFRQRFLEIG